MKHAYKFLVILLFLCFSNISSATQSNFYGVYVTGVNIDAGSNNVLFVKVNSLAGVGGCHADANWNFAISLDSNINPTGKYMFAVLLAAQTNGSAVDIVGQNTCSAFPTIQGIQRISYSK